MLSRSNVSSRSGRTGSPGTSPKAACIRSESRRSLNRRRIARRCSAFTCSIRRPTVRRSCGRTSRRCIRARRADHIQVTNGGSEANCISLMHLVQPGDEVVMMMPNYMQVHGLARAFGATVKPWALVQDSTNTRALAAGPRRSRVTRHSQDTRHPDLQSQQPDRRDADGLTSSTRSPALRRARARGFSPTRSIAAPSSTATRRRRCGDVSERVIVTSGLSKAYGLPGLRIGWVAGPAATVDALWGIHDYTSIAPGAVNDRLASIALRPARRQLILARTRGIIRTNYPIVKRWIDRRAPALSHVPPQAGAIVFVRYRIPHSIDRAGGSPA